MYALKLLQTKTCSVLYFDNCKRETITVECIIGIGQANVMVTIIFFITTWLSVVQAIFKRFAVIRNRCQDYTTLGKDT
jgi:hypothetical protein